MLDEQQQASKRRQQYHIQVIYYIPRRKYVYVYIPSFIKIEALELLIHNPQYIRLSLARLKNLFTMWMGLGSNRWLWERFSLLWFASQSRMSDVSHFVSTRWLSVSMRCSENRSIETRGVPNWHHWSRSITPFQQHLALFLSIYGSGPQITYSQWQTARLCVEEFGIYDSWQIFPRLD